MSIISFISCLFMFLSVTCTSGRSVLENPGHPQCGYASCPKPKAGYLNVHLIAHTHDDVGWLKTVDQYFFGSKSHIQKAGVQYILDSVIQELKHDRNKRFIYVETAFFWKWWRRQSDSERHLVRRLVARGQLEFIGGGWSMHDEATTHYHSIIDQFTWGLRKLNDTFGGCGVPRVGWQIDPFGHSRESASIMARLGFDGLFVGRIDYADKAQRMLHKQMEMVWEASPNIGGEADLFTGVNFNTYSAPSGFCFDILCDDEPIIDDKNSPDYNADRRAAEFIAQMEAQHLAYKSPANIAVTMGDDFNYQAAKMYFTNIDRLIKAVNDRQESAGSDVHVFYSTPSCYLKALNDEGAQWPTKRDDFFPYSSDPHSFWTGYYTSRPTLKRYERIGNNFLQVCKQLSALAALGPEAEGDLSAMREAMGVMQHHDAVSGTEKQAVAFDYARLLSRGMQECATVANEALNKLMPKSGESGPLALSSCQLLNISECSATEQHDTFVVTLYNPLSRPFSRYVRLPVAGDGHTYTVRDPDGTEVESQPVPVPEPVLSVPGRFSEAHIELVFRATDLPPLGFRSYYVTAGAGTGMSEPAHHQRLSGTHFTFGHKNGPKLTFERRSGHPVGLHAKWGEGGEGEGPTFQQSFYVYQSAVGDNEEPANRSSGAYIFRPAPNTSATIVNPQPTIRYYKGPLVEEVHQQFSSWVSQVIRAYRDEDHIEFNWMVGPIPISDKIGKEVVTRYNFYEMGTNGTFYTDSNGREMLRRELNRRPSYETKLVEPKAGNYYPVTTRATLRGRRQNASLITDRAQGAASLADGQLEFMLHRRILHDDAFGVGEALNEQAFGRGLVARGTHLLTYGRSVPDRKLVQERVLDAWTFLTPTRLTFDQWRQQYNMQFSGLKRALPDSVQILTLEPWKGNTFLLRLENILEKEDDASAEPTVVNLQDVFEPLMITWVRETTLGANQWLDEATRLVWKKEDNRVECNSTPERTRPQAVPIVKLGHMDIKTFVVEATFHH